MREQAIRLWCGVNLWKKYQIDDTFLATSRLLGQLYDLLGQKVFFLLFTD